MYKLPIEKSLDDSFWNQGDWNKKGQPEVDLEQLKIGIKIEYEHTNDQKIAERIALDHLSEISDYYDRLVKMEKEAKEQDKKL
jgi:hypothetical protein